MILGWHLLNFAELMFLGNIVGCLKSLQLGHFQSTPSLFRVVSTRQACHSRFVWYTALKEVLMSKALKHDLGLQSWPMASDAH